VDRSAIADTVEIVDHDVAGGDGLASQFPEVQRVAEKPSRRKDDPSFPIGQDDAGGFQLLAESLHPR